MSMSFRPNPVVGLRSYAADRTGVPAQRPTTQGGDIISRDDAIADDEANCPDRSATWKQVAGMIVDYPGEALVAAGIVSLPFWVFPLLRWLVGWSS